MFQKKRFFFSFFNFFFFSSTGCPTSGCALPGPRRKRAGRGGGTREKNPDWGLSRSNSLGFSLTLRAAETVEAGPRGRPSCCHTLREWQTAAAGWAAAGPGEAGKAQPGRGRSQRPRHQRQHCGNGAAARGLREDGRKGGAAPPDPCLPAPPPFAPPARSGSPTARRRPHLCRR